MLARLKRFIAGQPLLEQLTAARLNELLDLVEANTPRGGRGYVLKRNGQGGYSLDIKPSKGGGTITEETSLPWQPYPSPWLGTGDDPHSADRAKRFRLFSGRVTNRTPANMSDEFVAFGSLDATIKEADATYTQIYLKVPVSETYLGSGNLVVDRPSILLAQGQDLVATIGQDPDPGEDGSLPPYRTIFLFQTRVWGGKMVFDPAVNFHLWLYLQSSGSCESMGRTLVVSSLGQLA